MTFRHSSSRALLTGVGPRMWLAVARVRFLQCSVLSTHGRPTAALKLSLSDVQTLIT
jgi:hypothetical protein